MTINDLPFGENNDLLDIVPWIVNTLAEHGIKMEVMNFMIHFPCGDIRFDNGLRIDFCWRDNTYAIQGDENEEIKNILRKSSSFFLYVENIEPSYSLWYTKPRPARLSLYKTILYR